jgi:hypothetical protein
VLNWPQYGGYVMSGRTKNRSYYEVEPDNTGLIRAGAVFPLQLLHPVGKVPKARSLKPVDKGIRALTYPYPLNGITYCYHCNLLAQEHNDPKRRTRLGGFATRKLAAHHVRAHCSCTNRSVLAEKYETDFGRLIKLLTVRQEAIDLMVELSIQAGKAGQPGEVDVEKEKREAIALCRRRIDAAVHLYGEGRIDRDEYLRRVEANEREIAHWEARTTETEKIALELTLCMDALDKIARLWDVSDDEDRQGMARSLFTEVIYNLDTHRIVDFKLKPWADRFLVLRAALYEGENQDAEDSSSASQGMCTDVTPTGRRVVILSLREVSAYPRNSFSLWCTTSVTATLCLRRSSAMHEYANATRRVRLSATWPASIASRLSACSKSSTPTQNPVVNELPPPSTLRAVFVYTTLR